MGHHNMDAALVGMKTLGAKNQKTKKAMMSTRSNHAVISHVTERDSY